MQNRSAPPGAVVPVLIYEDLGKAIDWLCGAFGFTERLRAGPPENVQHAQLAVGDGGAVMLGAKRVGQGFAQPDATEFRPPRPEELNQYVHVKVDDVERHYQHARRFGARILQEPTTHMYGERQYTAEDLAGHRWTFSQSVRDADPREWGAEVNSSMNF